jgi:hypothetical protein
VRAANPLLVTPPFLFFFFFFFTEKMKKNLTRFFKNPESRTSLPGIAFGDFARRFQEPQLSEGFEDITKVDFTFQGGDEAKNVWSRFWV